ncbi:MAG: hypothetical protein RLZZ234_800, partial [Candidatus Parcubacteria bacterium]
FSFTLMWKLSIHASGIAVYLKYMKTYLLIGGGVVAVAIGIYVWILGGEAVPGEVQTAPTMTESMKMKHSLREFVSMGSMSVKCVFTAEDAQARTEGTTYVSDGKVRTDTIITKKGSGTKTTSSAIIDNEYMYAWGGELPHGMKMKLSAAKQVSADAEDGADTMGMDAQSAALDQAHDYACEAWNSDASYFALPAGITFTDYSEMMQGMMGGMMQKSDAVDGGTDAGMVDGEMMMDHGGMNMGGASGMPSKSVLCAACEQAPDAKTKAECNAKLQCL